MSFATLSSANAQQPGREIPPVTVEAPQTARVRPVTAQQPRNRVTTARRVPRPGAQPAAQQGSAQTAATTPGAFRDGLNRAPAGQTATTIDGSRYENRPSFSVSDVLRESPGISVKQGNGPRDIGISIRGSNARNGFGIRNAVIFDDGFPVTQPDGLSRSDLIDPHAYGAVDVIRGPSSALYGNYATGGAINFRSRPGREIDGFQYGVDGGTFGYLNNYMIAGKKVGNFEYSLFGSDVRGDGYIQNGWFNTQTVNFLGTLEATPNDRLTFKLINNTLYSRLPVRLSLNQYYQNPFQAGCENPLVAGCGTVSLLLNGFNGARGTYSAIQAGLNRDDRRTVLGGRWEHDFDKDLTWRNQFVFDDRSISQPTGATSAIGDFPSYNYSSDITKRGEILGMESSTLIGSFYNTLTATSDTRNVIPGGNGAVGLLTQRQYSETTNYGVRAREELKIAPALTAVAGIGWETTTLQGLNTAFTYPATGNPAVVTTALTRASREFQNTAPEFALIYRPVQEWTFRGRIATGYGVPQVGNLFVTSTGATGNNTDLRAQRNLGYDLGADWTPNRAVRLSATAFYEFFRDELVTQATPAGAANASYTFNAPKSEHRGVELAADLRFLEGWQFLAAYTWLDQIYTDYTEVIASGANRFAFNRAGNRIPGVSPNELTARLGYDHQYGALKGVGGFVEFVWKDAFYMDNGNLLKAPGYELVNLNLHYTTDLVSDHLKSLSMFFEVRNLFDRTYVASANNVSNPITAAGLQTSPATQTGSIYAGAPRTFVAGMKIAFR